MNRKSRAAVPGMAASAKLGGLLPIRGFLVPACWSPL